MTLLDSSLIRAAASSLPSPGEPMRRIVATVAPLPAAAALMRADAMRVLVLLRPTIARFAPSAASASAAANPMPLVAPVIRMCLSFTAQQSKALATRG